jgi:predicted membrane-bound spermidine synthase
VIVFIGGMVVMILELIGMRIFAPYLGTSIFVWSSLIGVILGSLSIGYWQGGVMADKKPEYKILAWILFSSAVLIVATNLLKQQVLLLSQYIPDIRIGAVLAALILFTPPTVFLGMIAPYAAKLKLLTLMNSGATIGKLYALSTIGSIVGTFLTGFVLIVYLGNTNILFLLSLLLICASFLAYLQEKGVNVQKRWFLIFIAGLSINGLNLLPSQGHQDNIEVETPYTTAWIMEGIDKKTSKAVRYLLTEPGVIQSGIYLDNDNLLFEYSKFFRLAKYFNSDIKHSLMVGGGAYSYPKDYLKMFPEATMDVVEIDPKLTALARRYFNLRENPRLNIHHEDGRTFLNKSANKYDVIFMDVFKSVYSVPYQLTTIEVAQKMRSLLNENGLVLVNIISAIEGRGGKFLRAEYKTFKEVFPQVYLFPVKNADDGKEKQNIILGSEISKQRISIQRQRGI